MSDDTISRQAVLEATSTTLKITGKENAETVYKYIKKLCDDIKALPSAQQWIPCSERLPSMGERVVVSAVHHKTEDVVIDILRYHGKKYGWEFKDICTPVAWMPLPEIYKEEEK